MKRGNVRRLTVAALMGAVAFVLQYFSFSIPVLSAFAELDLSALPELIGGFILGPVGAVMIVTVKLLLYMIFKGTSSMYTGEIQNFLLSCAYVLPAVLYYRKHRTKQGALVGIVLGSIVSVVASIRHELGLHPGDLRRGQPLDQGYPHLCGLLGGAFQPGIPGGDLGADHAAL